MKTKGRTHVIENGKTIPIKIDPILPDDQIIYEKYESEIVELVGEFLEKARKNFLTDETKEKIIFEYIDSMKKDLLEILTNKNVKYYEIKTTDDRAKKASEILFLENANGIIGKFMNRFFIASYYEIGDPQKVYEEIFLLKI